MVRTVPNRRTVSTLRKRIRTTAAYSRRQSSTGLASDPDENDLELTAMATAAT